MINDGDELLKKALDYVDVEGHDDVKADLENDDYPIDLQIELILAKGILALRPDLKQRKNKDVVFIVKSIVNGKETYSLPSNSLDEILKSTPPYDDSLVCTYDLCKRKILKKLYQGTGTIWECL